GARPDLGVLHLAPPRPLAIGGGHAPGAGECEPVRRPLAAVVTEPLATVGTRHDLPDAVAELRGRTLGHAGGWLEHVAIRVDDRGALHGRRLPEACVEAQGGFCCGQSAERVVLLEESQLYPRPGEAAADGAREGARDCPLAPRPRRDPLE